MSGKVKHIRGREESTFTSKNIRQEGVVSPCSQTQSFFIWRTTARGCQQKEAALVHVSWLISSRFSFNWHQSAPENRLTTAETLLPIISGPTWRLFVGELLVFKFYRRSVGLFASSFTLSSPPHLFQTPPPPLHLLATWQSNRSSRCSWVL